MMTITEYRRTIESEYTDTEGFITRFPSAEKWSSGNEAVDTAIHYAILDACGALELRDMPAVDRIYSALWADGKPGLMSRNATRPDQNSWDNYVAACAADAIVRSTSVASLIDAYGRSHCYIFQNEPGISNFVRAQFWRFSHVVAFMRMCACSGPYSASVLARFIESDGDGAGADQIRWLMSRAALAILTRGLSESEMDLLDVARTKPATLARKYDSLPLMFAAYYGSAHPFANVEIPTT